MYDSFALRRLGISAAAALALALSACGGGGGGGSPAELAAAPAPGDGAAPADGNSAAAGAPPRAGEGGGSLPVEERLSVEPGAEEGVPVGEGAGEGGPAAPGGGSASPSGAAWHVFGEVGTGGNGAALVTSGDLAALPVEGIVHSAVTDVEDGVFVGQRSAPYPALNNRRDETGLWIDNAQEGWDGVYRKADSGLSQSSLTLPRRTGNMNGGGAIAVGLGRGANGGVSYKLSYSHVLENSGSLLESWTLDSEAAGANVRKLSSGGSKGAVFRREDSQGSLWAIVMTDVANAGDTDWLATGMWAWTPADGAARAHRFGVFADGGDPFEHSGGGLGGRPEALTGVATYAGDAAGVYTRLIAGARKTDFFEADVTLSADFSADPVGSGAGLISGSVSGFEVAGSAIAGNPVLTLGESGLGAQGSTAGSSVNGVTSMSFGGHSWAGKWGSQFFGKDANEIPLSVVGTFGAVAGAYGSRGGHSAEIDPSHPNVDREVVATRQAFVGAFTADRTSYEDTPERPEPRQEYGWNSRGEWAPLPPQPPQPPQPTP